MSERLLVAVDGGGSGSRALAFSADGRALELFRGPPLNYAALGPGVFVENLRLLLRPIARGFASAIGGYVFSLAGVSAYREEVEELLQGELRPARLWLLTDIEATYMAATLGRDAIVVSAGTGSFAYGRRGGREARVGGWGYLFGDEGGAYWIGRELVRRVLMHCDGRLAVGEQSLQLLLEALGVTSAVEALGKLYREHASPDRVAGLSKVACRAAESGCKLALELIDDAAEQLELMVSAVAERLSFEGGALVYGTGGVILGCRPLAEALRRRVEARGMRFKLKNAPPLLGCVLYYLRAVEGLSERELEVINIEIPGGDDASSERQGGSQAALPP